MIGVKKKIPNKIPNSECHSQSISLLRGSFANLEDGISSAIHCKVENIASTPNLHPKRKFQKPL
jgi:hypothetical protein